MSVKTKKLKVGILVDDLLLNYYSYNLYKFLLNSNDFHDPVIVYGYSNKPSKNKNFKNLFSKNIFQLLKKKIV